MEKSPGTKGKGNHRYSWYWSTPLKTTTFEFLELEKAFFTKNGRTIEQSIQ